MTKKEAESRTQTQSGVKMTPAEDYFDSKYYRVHLIDESRQPLGQTAVSRDAPLPQILTYKDQTYRLIDENPDAPKYILTSSSQGIDIPKDVNQS
jgi:hypothetical protein